MKKLKRFLCTILAVCLLFSMISVVSAAAASPLWVYSAQELGAALRSGETNIVISSDITVSSTLRFGPETNIEILDGVTVTFTANQDFSASDVFWNINGYVEAASGVTLRLDKEAFECGFAEDYDPLYKNSAAVDLADFKADKYSTYIFGDTDLALNIINTTDEYIDHVTFFSDVTLNQDVVINQLNARGNITVNSNLTVADLSVLSSLIIGENGTVNISNESDSFDYIDGVYKVTSNSVGNAIIFGDLFDRGVLNETTAITEYSIYDFDTESDMLAFANQNSGAVYAGESGSFTLCSLPTVIKQYIAVFSSQSEGKPNIEIQGRRRSLSFRWLGNIDGWFEDEGYGLDREIYTTPGELHGIFYFTDFDSNLEWIESPVDISDLQSQSISISALDYYEISQSGMNIENADYFVKLSIDTWQDDVISFGDYKLPIYLSLPPVGYYSSPQAQEDTLIDNFRYTQTNREFYAVPSSSEGDTAVVVDYFFNEGEQYVTVQDQGNGAYRILVNDDVSDDFFLRITFVVERMYGTEYYDCDIDVSNGSDTLKAFWANWGGTDSPFVSEGDPGESTLVVQPGVFNTIQFAKKVWDQDNAEFVLIPVNAADLSCNSENVTFSENEIDNNFTEVVVSDYGDYTVSYNGLEMKIVCDIGSFDFFSTTERSRETCIKDFVYNGVNNTFYAIFEGLDGENAQIGTIYSGGENIEILPVGDNCWQITVNDDVRENFDLEIEIDVFDGYGGMYNFRHNIRISNGYDSLVAYWVQWNGETPVIDQFCSTKLEVEPSNQTLMFALRTYNNDTRTFENRFLSAADLSCADSNIEITENDRGDNITDVNIKDFGTYTITYGAYELPIICDVGPFAFYTANSLSQDSWTNHFDYTDDDNVLYLKANLQEGETIMYFDVLEGDDIMSTERISEDTWKVTIDSTKKLSDVSISAIIGTEQEYSLGEWIAWATVSYAGEGLMVTGVGYDENNQPYIRDESSDYELNLEVGERITLAFADRTFNANSGKYEVATVKPEDIVSSSDDLVISSNDTNSDFAIVKANKVGEYTLTYQGHSMSVNVSMPYVGMYTNASVSEDTLVFNDRTVYYKDTKQFYVFLSGDGSITDVTLNAAYPGHELSQFDGVTVTRLSNKYYSVTIDDSVDFDFDLECIATVDNNNTHGQHRNMYHFEYSGEPVLGDADMDGVVTIMDVTTIQQHLAELIASEQIDLTVSDTDGDGIVSIMDATRIQLFLANLISSVDITTLGGAYAPPEHLLTEFENKKVTVTRQYSTMYSLKNLSAPVLGDSDMDGVVSIMDATAIQQYLTQLITPEKIDLSVADTNSDGVVNIIDATKIQLFLASFIASLDVTTLEGAYAPPEYWLTEIENKEATVRSLQNSSGTQASFVWFSDPHIYDGNQKVQNIGKVANYAAAQYNIPLIACTGDNMSQASYSTQEEVLAELDLVSKIYAPINKKKFLCVVGNHDGAYGKYNDDSYVNQLSSAQIGDILSRWQSGDDGRVYGDSPLYFYTDNEQQKTRYIMLCSHYGVDDSVDDNGNATYQRQRYTVYGQPQLEWLANTALDLPSGYDAVIITHSPAQNARDSKLVKGVIDAFNNRTAYSDTATVNEIYYAKTEEAVSVDFPDASGEIIALFHGHIHKDNIDTETLSCPQISITTAGGDVRDDNAPQRVLGTATETALDVVTIDKSSRTIYMTRLGAGSDRQVSY